MRNFFIISDFDSINHVTSELNTWHTKRGSIHMSIVITHLLFSFRVNCKLLSNSHVIWGFFFISLTHNNIVQGM